MELAATSPKRVFVISPELAILDERVTNPFEIARTRFALVIVTMVKNLCVKRLFARPRVVKIVITTPEDYFNEVLRDLGETLHRRALLWDTSIPPFKSLAVLMPRY